VTDRPDHAHHICPERSVDALHVPGELAGELAAAGDDERDDPSPFGEYPDRLDGASQRPYLRAVDAAHENDAAVARRQIMITQEPGGIYPWPEHLEVDPVRHHFHEPRMGAEERRGLIPELLRDEQEPTRIGGKGESIDVEDGSEEDRYVPRRRGEQREHPGEGMERMNDLYAMLLERSAQDGIRAVIQMVQMGQRAVIRSGDDVQPRLAQTLLVHPPLAGKKPDIMPPIPQTPGQRDRRVRRAAQIEPGIGDENVHCCRPSIRGRAAPGPPPPAPVLFQNMLYDNRLPSIPPPGGPVNIRQGGFYDIARSAAVL